MEPTFLTEIEIKKVRHLKNITIPLSKEKRKHLILTGKNGSGKTSVLEALAAYLRNMTGDVSTEVAQRRRLLAYMGGLEKLKNGPEELEDRVSEYAAEPGMKYSGAQKEGIRAAWTSRDTCLRKYKEGAFILAYYGDDRKAQTERYRDIEQVELEKVYKISDTPGTKLAKYLVNLKAVQAFSKEPERVEKIQEWFERFEGILRDLFEDPTLVLQFDEEKFLFSIHTAGREPFDFNTMSSGYSAILEIVNDLIMRMEAASKLRTSFDMEGVVLIDEIETHLHLELQKKILGILTELFPNLQFIVSTHSPFVLNSAKETVVYDLEEGILVPEGLTNLPYEGIVEGYFGADRLSGELRTKFNRYKELAEYVE